MSDCSPEARPTPLVIDDVGFPRERWDGRGFEVPFAAYERLLSLARSHGIAIPVAVTAGFVDLDGMAEGVMRNPQAGRIVDFLIRNHEHLPVWNHGLTHSIAGEATEFGLLGQPGSVPEERQREHLERSQAIFARVGLPVPEDFVPPGHAWEPGLTDRLAKDCGIRRIAIRAVEKKSLVGWLRTPTRPYVETWAASDILHTRFRLGLGIPYNQRRLTSLTLRKVREYVRPSNRWIGALVHRRLTPQERPDHHFAHLQNFCREDAMPIWRAIVGTLLEESDP